jgi:hypothetical protein
LPSQIAELRMMMEPREDDRVGDNTQDMTHKGEEEEGYDFRFERRYRWWSAATVFKTSKGRTLVAIINAADIVQTKRTVASNHPH